MIKKCLIALSGILVIGIVIWGICQKSTYTDIVSEDSYMDELLVAEMTEGLAQSLTEVLKTELPASPMVMRVTAMKDREYEGREGRQYVHVEKVYQGDTTYENKEIYITGGNWGVDAQYIDLGFVNVMRVNEEYLVFITDKVDIVDGKMEEPVFRLLPYIITPVFSYNEYENIAVPVENIDEEGTYVQYRLVSDNEFFAMSDEGIQYLLDLKEDMLSRYPR